MFLVILIHIYFVLGVVFQCLLLLRLIDRLKIYYLLKKMSVSHNTWEIAGKIEYFLRDASNYRGNRVYLKLKELLPNIDDEYAKILHEIL